MKSPTKCFSRSLLCYLFIHNLLSTLAKVYDEPLLLRCSISVDGQFIYFAQTTASSTEFKRCFSINGETGNCIQVNPGMTLARFQLQKLNASSQKLLFFILRQGQFYLHLVQYFAFHSLSLTAQFCNSIFFPLHILLSYCLRIKTTQLCRNVSTFCSVVQTYSIQRQKFVWCILLIC
jgi:hypothetical protein